MGELDGLLGLLGGQSRPRARAGPEPGDDASARPPSPRRTTPWSTSQSLVVDHHVASGSSLTSGQVRLRKSDRASRASTGLTARSGRASPTQRRRRLRARGRRGWPREPWRSGAGTLRGAPGWCRRWPGCSVSSTLPIRPAISLRCSRARARASAGTEVFPPPTKTT